MGRAIVKINDLYFEWSTIVDAPVTFGVSLEEIKNHFLEEYGRRGALHIDESLSRLEKNGTSWISPTTVEETIAGNRAGPDESELTLEEIYTAYGKREPIRNGWVAK